MTNRDMTRRAFVTMGTLLLFGCGAKEESASGEMDGQTEGQASTREGSSTEEAPSSEAAAESASDGGSQILVAYYSRADENYPSEWLEVGHTKVMAGYVAEALGADTYEIVPAKAYPEGYDDCCDVALEEQRADARPAIANELPDTSGYDVVFVGCPIWWGEEPMIVRSFLDGVDLSGKTVVPFTTHGGSGLGSVPENLRAAIPDATLLDGLAVAGTSVDGSRDEVIGWATSLSLA